MAKPKRIKVTKQYHDWDCGIATLAMLLDKPYGDVAAVVRDVVDAKKLRKRGTTIADMQLVANAFGVSLRVIWRKKGYLEGQTGILGLKGGKMDKAGHWVILKAGKVIVDTDNEVWELEDYLKRFKCRSTLLLVEDKD